MLKRYLLGCQFFDPPIQSGLCLRNTTRSTELELVGAIEDDAFYYSLFSGTLEADFEVPEISEPLNPSTDSFQLVNDTLAEVNQDVPNPLAPKPEENVKLFYRAEEIEDDFVLISEN